MNILTLEQKQYMFAAAATKKTKSAPAKPRVSKAKPTPTPAPVPDPSISSEAKSKKPRAKKSTTTATKKKLEKEPDLGGMLMAAGLDTDPEKQKPRARKSEKTKKPEEKHGIFYKELNKYGLTSLVMGSVANHAINTSYKLAAAIEGKDELFKHYEEKSKNYIKPHFSLPSQWHQSRITFGTPWYY